MGYPVAVLEDLPMDRRGHYISSERAQKLTGFALPEFRRYIEAGYISVARTRHDVLVYDVSRFYQYCDIVIPKLATLREAEKLTGLTERMLKKYIALGRLATYTSSGQRMYVDIGNILASPGYLAANDSPVRNSRKVVFYAHEHTSRSDERLRQIEKEYPHVTAYVSLNARQTRDFARRLLASPDIKLLTSTAQEMDYIEKQKAKFAAKDACTKVEVECASN